jgi:hypothetical protein
MFAVHYQFIIPAPGRSIPIKSLKKTSNIRREDDNRFLKVDNVAPVVYNSRVGKN